MRNLARKIITPVLLATAVAGGIAVLVGGDTAPPAQAAEPATPAAAECEVASTDICNCVFWSCPWCAS